MSPKPVVVSVEKLKYSSVDQLHRARIEPRTAKDCGLARSTMAYRKLHRTPIIRYAEAAPHSRSAVSTSLSKT